MRIPRIVSFESRRQAEMAQLIERFGGHAFVAPSMREIPIGDNPAALKCIQQIIEGQFSTLILLTGVGTNALLDVARSHSCFPELIEAMSRMSIAVRGPKPAAALSAVGLRYDIKAAEPNTWREMLTAIEESGQSLAGTQVAVQEYGIPNHQLSEALTQRGARVTAIPVYRWALPEDVQPLQEAIRLVCAGESDVVLFTSAQQIVHVLQIAESSKSTEAFGQALRTGIVGSIGPTCSEALRSRELPVDVEARPPKMAALVRQVLARFSEVPRADRGAPSG